MRDLFPGWVPPNEETLDRYWRKATFAVDTSVLLDLYRFSGEARERLVTALHSFGERLWIPHQVALEYHRNRLGVLLDQREAESGLLRELDQIRENLDGQLSQLLRGAGRRDLAPLRDAIDDGFDGLREKLKEAEHEHTRGLGESLRDDPVYEEVLELCTGRVGDPFDDEEYKAVIEDAEKRFSTETPPGYLDREKEDEARFGDVILWHQLCSHAEDSHRPVVLIADDQKADWIWEVRGKSVGPRPELVAEMMKRAGVGFHLYTPTRFLQIWEQKEEGRDIEPDVLAEMEDSGRVKPAQVRLLMLRRYLEAYGLSQELAGESANNPWIPRLMQSIEKLRPRAVHNVGETEVFLALEFPPMHHPGSVPRVTVRDPNGNLASSSGGPHHSGEPGEGLFFPVTYPTHFEDAQGLPAGRYEVTWEIYPDLDKSSPAMSTVTDSFLVEGA